MAITAEMVKQVAIQAGADLVGIGDIDRFEGAPRDFDPRFIFPEARTIIGLAFRVHRGLYRGIEEGTFFAALPSMGYANINDIHAPIALRAVGNFLEDNGYEAVLYQNTSVRMGANAGRPVRPGLPRPDVFIHFRIAAFICGLGQIGYSKLLITPRFGPRVRFAFIITDAPLRPDPIYSGPPLCDMCMLCVKECPAGAISPDKTVEVTVAGHTIVWGKLDEQACAAVYQAGTPEYSPFMTPQVADYVKALISTPPEQRSELFKAHPEGPFSFIRNNLPYCRNAWESYHHPGAICGARGCQRACFIHLEEQGKLENKFHRPFRIRRPWSLPPA